MRKVSLIASGDAFITRRIPKGGYPGFGELQSVISKHDVAFSNLEMTFHHYEAAPCAVSGGTWAAASPACLDDLCSYGFNLFTTANNHSCDFGGDGVLATIRHLEERNLIYSGTGRNLAEASRACYLELPGVRVALVSACASFHPTDAAGGQSGQMAGRPGLNPLHTATTYHVTDHYFRMVQELGNVTYANAYENYGIRLGYISPKPEGIASLGSCRFKLDQENRVESVPVERDMKRIEEEVREAARQADVVLVSIHAHETDRDDFTVPSESLQIFSRRCIDAGASAVLGHGPHELRGIERYKGGVIFYSLGNFIFETETVQAQPHDAFYSKGLPADTKIGEYMDSRSQGGTRGYITQENIWRSVLAGWTMEAGKITQVQLHPISLGMQEPRSQRGVPVLSHDVATLEYLSGLSKPFGTELRISGDTGYIDL